METFHTFKIQSIDVRIDDPKHRRELTMYREVLPALDAFCRAEAGLTTFMELFPRFHGAGLVGGDLYLVFEDILSSGGRYVTGKREFHSAEEVVLSLRGLASLHAASYCYQVTTNQRLGTVQYSTYSTAQYSIVQYSTLELIPGRHQSEAGHPVPDLGSVSLPPRPRGGAGAFLPGRDCAQGISCDCHWNSFYTMLSHFVTGDSMCIIIEGWFIKHIKILRAVCRARAQGDHTATAKLARGCEDSELARLERAGPRLMEAVYSLLHGAGDSSVLAHGDFHMWNIAFTGTRAQPPAEAVFFDLQASRLTSGVDDIVQYLYQAGDSSGDL